MDTSSAATTHRTPGMHTAVLQAKGDRLEPSAGDAGARDEDDANDYTSSPTLNIGTGRTTLNKDGLTGETNQALDSVQWVY